MRDSVRNFLNLLRGRAPVLALAPMQDVTTLEFMRVWRATAGRTFTGRNTSASTDNSRPGKMDSRSITENPTGKPVVAQLIGNDIPALVRIRRRSCSNIPLRRLT
jgi:tRNA-dihydrouridine synthase B